MDRIFNSLVRVLDDALNAEVCNPATGRSVPYHSIRLKAAAMVLRLMRVSNQD